jgi:hypothetical protein
MDVPPKPTTTEEPQSVGVPPTEETPSSQRRSALMEAIEGGEEAPKKGFMESVGATWSWFVKEVADDWSLTRASSSSHLSGTQEGRDAMAQFDGYVRLQSQYSNLLAALQKVCGSFRNVASSHTELAATLASEGWKTLSFSTLPFS